MEKISLSSTAALVMNWALPLYNEVGTPSCVVDYLSMLDLSSGDLMKNQVEQHCPWYGEVIINRKYIIRNLVFEEILQSSSPVQVFIPAAGWSPLGLELIERFPNEITRVIECDIAGMEEKQALYQSIVPEYVNRMVCVTADVSHSDIISSSCITESGNRLVVIAEGITYFLSSEWTKNLIELSCRNAEQSTLIIEYLLPDMMISPKRRTIPKMVFDMVSACCNVPPPVVFSQQDLIDYACQIPNMSDPKKFLCTSFNLKDIEEKRTGRNEWFQSDNSGWIQISKISFA
jgi:hypothetical protein